jgi:hypothetical protein
MADTKTAPNVQPVDDAGWETVVEPFGETATFENPGDTLIGTYKSKKEVETDDLNNPGEKRNQMVYEIEGENGKLWSVWESYNVQQGMEKASVGDLVRIKFVNKVPIDNGKRTVKQFEIAVKRS